MKIETISITKLFGSLNHEILLSGGGVTFIHGPNGCGKTTVLRLVNFLLNGEIQALKVVDFSTLKIGYSDGNSLLATRTLKEVDSHKLFGEDDEILRATADLTITLVNKIGNFVHEFEYTKQLQKITQSDRPFPMSIVERKLPFLTRTGMQQWTDLRNGQIIGIDTIIAKYADRLGATEQFKWPIWLTDRLNVSKIGFVRAQRLINISALAKSVKAEDVKESRDVVEIYSAQIKDTIAKKLAESAIQSQARDRSFPRRLINKEFPKNVVHSDFLETYSATEERGQNLMAAGLLDQAASIPLPKRRLTKAERDVLALYLSDFNEKLDAFTDLQRRIEAFVDIVGSKLRRKKFIVDRQLGFVFETDDLKPRRLAVTDLSSGEQHQIVLFYELIFASAGINFFLIDEPEISLHVEWQRAFIKDIEKVQNLTNATFLIATHSPQIINNRRDLAVPLDGGLSL